MDIIEWLEENQIDVKTSGKNVSAGWVGIRCLFCDDSSNHLGIRVKDLKCSCWKCGGHSIVTVVQEISETTRKQARDIVKTLDGDEERLLREQKYDPDAFKKYSTKLPLHLNTFPKQYRDYLRSRNFHPNRIKRKYELLAAGHLGEYKFRIIIPIYMNRRLASFTTRAIIDQMEPKYKNAKITESLISPKDCIYNYDSIRMGYDCLVVEGAVDVWRWGDGSCSTIGLQFSQAQLSALRKKQIRNLFVMMDAERYAQRVKAEEIARLMAPWISGKVEILEAMWKKDLGDFTPNEAYKLRKQLNFKASPDD